MVGFLKSYGIDEPAGCYDDFDIADYFFLWGANMAEMHPMLFNRILRRRQADEAIERILAEPRRALAALEPGPAREAQPAPRITGRQREILRLIAQGKATKQIAAALGVSLHTARRHVQNVLERLEAHSKAEAVSRAFKDRLL